MQKCYRYTTDAYLVFRSMAARAGLEPATSGLVGDNDESVGPREGKLAKVENYGALPIELSRKMWRSRSRKLKREALAPVLLKSARQVASKG